MSENAPIRLRLSRRKGFNLQEISRDINGREAVCVARPTMWGNRWKIGVRSNFLGRNIETLSEAVDVYRALAWPEDYHRAWVRENLAGKNLACWCALDSPCHADVLLEIANSD